MSSTQVIVFTLRQKLQEIASTKAIERRKGIDSLKEYLYEDEVIQYLDEVSASKNIKGIKWDNLFESAIECLGVEASKGSKKSKDVITAARNFIETILSKGTVYISGTKFINVILEIWESNILRNELEDFCCRLIASNLLKNECYWSKINNDKWHELTNLVFEIYSKYPEDPEKLKICLNILLLILKHGTSYSCIALNLKKRLFQFLLKLLEDNSYFAQNDFLKELYLLFLISLSNKLGSECKVALCELGENVIPRLSCLIYDHKRSSAKVPIMSLLYKAILKQFNCHHPLGIDYKESAYSVDRQKWKESLKRVYYIIDSEITRLQKSKETESNPNFFNLAVHLIAWFYDDTEDVTLGDITSCDTTLDADESVRVKRIKLTVYKIEYYIERLQSCSNPLDIWPILHLVACLIYRFPKLITVNEYKTLLKMFSEYQSNNFTSNETVMDYLYECFFSFFLAWKHLKELSDEDDLIIQQIWRNVFHNTNRSIGLNISITSSHMFLRWMLVSKPDLCQPELLLQLFTDKVVSLNEDSLKTLFYLISKLPTDTVARLKLVEWLVPISENSYLNDSLISNELHASCLLLLCTNIKSDQLECVPSELDHFFSFLEPTALENEYLKNNFHLGLLTGSTGVSTGGSHRKENYSLIGYINNKEIIFNSAILKRIDDHFMKSKTNVVDQVGKETIDYPTLRFTTNWFSFWTAFCRYADQLPAQSKLRSSLQSELPEVLKITIEKLSSLHLVSSNLFINLFNVFYNMNMAHASVSKHLLPLINEDLLKVYFTSMSVSNLPSGNIIEFTLPKHSYPKELKVLKFHHISITFTDRQLKIFQNVILMAEYGCNQTGRLTENQSLVLSSLFDIAEKYLNAGYRNMHLLVGTYVIHKILGMDCVDSEMIKNCIVTYYEMCRAWVKQSDIVGIILLPFLKQFLLQVQNKHEEYRDELLNILTNFYTIMKSKVYGVSVQIQIVECFGLLAVVDPTMDWSISSANCLEIKEKMECASLPLLLEIFAFISSPFHQVRMKALSYLFHIFHSSNIKITKTVFGETDFLFKLLCSYLEDMLVIEDELASRSEAIDEKVNRFSCFFHALATTIVTSPCFFRKSLYYLFVMYGKKKLNQQLFKRVLRLIIDHFRITPKEFLSKNMFYLLTSWYDEFNTFKSFPYQIINYESELIFFQCNYLNITSILIINENKSELEHYSKLISKPVAVLYQDALPKSMALKEKIITSIDNYVKDSTSTLRNSLPEIIFELISNTTDYTHLNISACVPQPCPTDVTFITLKKHLELLKQKLLLNSPLVTFLCQTQPSTIQKIQLKLSRCVYEASSFEFKIEAVHRYEMFLQLLRPTFLQQDPIIAYLTQSILYTLLHNLSTKDDEIDSDCVIIRCLHTFLEFTLPHCTESIMCLLPYMIGTLVPVTLMKTSLSQPSFDIIRLVVIKHGDSLREGITMLDPFPRTEEYETICEIYEKLRGFSSSNVLLEELLHFVKAGESNSNEQCRLQGLINLNKLLTSRRQELHTFNELSIRSEKGKFKKVINKLVLMLSQLATSSNPMISEKAIICLGKIGPYSMNATVLASKTRTDRCNADEMLTLFVASELIKYLSSEQIKVANLASEALYHLLDSREGVLIIEKLLLQERKLIFPFIPLQKKKTSTITLTNLFNDTNFGELINVSSLWVPISQLSHSNWISGITRAFIGCFSGQHCYLKYLTDLCDIQTDFAESFLKYLIHFIIKIPSRLNEARTILSTRISHFFFSHCSSDRDRTADSNVVYFNKKSIQCMLDVVHFVRIHQDTPDKHLLNLNYLNVAQAALYCASYHSAILYAQLSCDVLLSGLKDKFSVDQSLSTLDYICNYKQREGSNLQDILRQAYTEINETDTVYGCGHSNIKDMTSRISHYKHTNNWHQVIECCDILSNQSSLNQQAMLKRELNHALAQCGLYHILNEVSERQQYEACWRLSQWDVVDNISEEASFDLYHYKALKCLHEGEHIQSLANINAARQSLKDSLYLTDLDSTTQIQSVLSKLQMLQEVEEFNEHKTNHVNAPFNDVINTWNSNKFIGDVEFKLIEPILSQRCVLLNESSEDTSEIVQYNLELSQKARLENQFAISQRILATIEPKCKSQHEKLNLQFEQAQLFWDRNEFEAARFLLRMILPKLKHTPDSILLYSRALRTYGSWQASIKSENLSYIIEKYLNPALEELKTDHLEDRLKTYDCLAKNADEKFKQICSILSNANKMQRSEDRNKIAMKNLEIDNHERATHLSERKQYLHIAMKFYIKGLAEGELNDIKVFRVVSLWFDNSEDKELLKMLTESLLSIPSYKFVKVLPQLVARIGNDQSTHNILLLDVIEKCAKEHPHHTIPLILAVANSYKDEMFGKQGRGGGDTSSKNPLMQFRILGAEYLLNKLKKQKSDNNIKEILKQMESLSNAYIKFANYFLGDDRKKANKHTISNSEPLMKISNLDHIFVSTINVPLSKEGVYDDVIGIHKFENIYSIPGGINEPKRIVCIGTNGERYIQLLKGKDDPRQDAVMQQVFTIMNDLLKANKAASKRMLSVVTYKVLPLSQQSGVIEWCNDSLPIHLYLVGDREVKGAHAKYYEKDMTNYQCRDVMARVAKESTFKKLIAYRSICQKFRPVMRYFFLEKFENANEWHSMQTNYTRSVATSSMIGYIMGLGDRHLNNILISLKTAEIIHIDFGIAFEQGLILPTPETIPFRLTRDIEDGMGVTGVEGTFRKSCETTLSVLREHSETILTILEVLLYDPLYAWTMTASKAADKQQISNRDIYSSEPDVPVNKIASRALFRVKQKLQGIEEGNIFSVEGQTNILIQRARDPENLCRVFAGWQPYL